jgi:hypothetical protein
MAATDKLTIQAAITAHIRSGFSDTTANDLKAVFYEILDSYTNALNDTASNFTTNNPILLVNQIGIESDSLTTSPKFKIGNGITTWNSLPYANQSTLQQILANGNSTGNSSITSPLGHTSLNIVDTNLVAGYDDGTSGGYLICDANRVTFVYSSATTGGIVNINTPKAEVVHDLLIELTAPSIKKNGVELATITDVNNAIIGLLDDRGNYDASINLFPSSGGSGTSGAILKGDLWTISVAGTLGGVVVTVGDVVRCLSNTPGQTSANWTITEYNLGYVPENANNKVTSVVGNTTSNTVYASVKAIYDWAVGLFAPLASPTFTGTVTVPTPVNNTDAATKAYVDSSSAPDFDYVLMSSFKSIYNY